jgi:hypothetical protein
MARRDEARREAEFEKARLIVADTLTELLSAEAKDIPMLREHLAWRTGSWLVPALMSDVPGWRGPEAWIDGIAEALPRLSTKRGVVLAGGAIVYRNVRGVQELTLNPIEARLRLAPAVSTVLFEGERGAQPYRSGSAEWLHRPSRRDDWAAFDFHLPPTSADGTS